MTALKDLVLWFNECAGLSLRAEIEDIVSLLARFGLVPVEAGWGSEARPVVDVPAYLAGVHSVSPKFKKPEPGLSSDMWILKLVRVDQPFTEIVLFISCDQLDGSWRIRMSTSVRSYIRQGLSLEDFGDSWTELVDALGPVLYERTRPALGIASAASDRQIGTEKDISQRRLLVGWRTWYGPAYVETFGRDWLLGLPDHAYALDDGGVAHTLEADLATVVGGDADPYARVWPYLALSKVRPAWPKITRPRKMAPKATVDAELTEFRRAMHGLLSTAIVVDGNQRVLVLAPDWSVLADTRLGGPKRALLLHSVREAAERELREHPAARIRFELGEDAPDDLRHLLDGLAHQDLRLNYVVLPSQT
jgi:hypothetical protein